MGEDIKAVPQGMLFAQIDTRWAIKDYPPIRNCIRLIGVDTYSFEKLALAFSAPEVKSWVGGLATSRSG